MVEVKKLKLEGIVEILPAKYCDARGFFSETWSNQSIADTGLDLMFVQDNHSYSASPGVLRGLHFQTPPFAQDKLVRVVRGEIFDVAVDIRKGSPTFGQWTSILVSAKKWNQILVPKGFAHGYVTTAADTEVIYKVTAPYAHENDRSVRYDDPGIGIKWPVGLGEFQLSQKDRDAPALKDVETGFHWP